MVVPADPVDYLELRVSVAGTGTDPELTAEVLDSVGQRCRGATDVAIVRMERLYPLPQRTLPEVLGRYSGAELRWVQEEPANQGAWPFMGLNLAPLIGRDVVPVTRAASSSPAVGSHHRHEEEQAALLAEAFD